MTQRTWVKLVTEHEAALITEWQVFADEFEMPLWAALESAMELLIAVTAKAEAQAQQEADAARLAQTA